MSKHLRCIGACLCLLFSMTMQAEKGPYGIFSEKDTTLTLYYGEIPEDSYRYDPSANSVVWTNPLYANSRLGKLVRMRITKSFREYAPKSLNRFCAYFEKLRTVEGINNLRTESVTDMSEMFRGCKSLKEIDLRGLDTRSVVNMRYMFYECRALTSINLTTFNTSSVTDMYGMFWQTALETIDLSSFDTRKVTNTSYMFFNIKNLRSVIVGSGWMLNTSSLDAENMFEYCGNIQGEKGTTYDESHIDYSYAHVDGGASNPGYLTLKVSKKVPYAEGTYSVKKRSQNGPFGFDKLVIKYGYMPMTSNAFEINCDGENWWKNDVDSFFAYSETMTIDASMKEYPLKTTANMFANCTSVRYLSGLKYLNTDSVTDMTGMFYQCDALGKYLDFKGFNTRNVTKMDSMFANMGVCIPEDEMKDASNGERKKYRYTLDLRELDTRNVTSMEKMFYQLYWVDTLDISSFDTRKVTNMSNMFRDGPNNYIASGESFLKTIYVGDNWSTASLINTEAGIFGKELNGGNGGVSALFGGAGTYKDVLYDFYGYEVAHVDGGVENPGLFTSHNPKTFPVLYGVKNGSVFRIGYGIAPKSAYTNGSSWAWMCGSAEDEHDIDLYGNYILNPHKIYTVEIDSTVKKCSPKTLAMLFYDFEKLLKITGLEYLRTDSVRSLSQMFGYCNDLTSIDLRNFDTRQVTGVQGMFYDCESLKTIYVGGNWIMTDKAIQNYSIEMFYGCSKLVGGAGTKCKGGNATYAHIDGGPSNPGYLTEYKLVPYAVVKRSTRPHYYWGDIEYGEAAGYDTLTIKYGFPEENAFEIVCDGKNWWKNDKDTFVYFSTYINIDPSFSKYPIKTTANMFKGCWRLEEVNGLKYINTDSVTDMSGMFAECNDIVKLDLEGFKTPNVTKMDSMFFQVGFSNNYSEPNYLRYGDDNYGSYVDLNLADFNTQNVTSMESMFSCARVHALDISSFDTRKVTNMKEMLYGCAVDGAYNISVLKKIYVGENWSVEAVENKQEIIFNGAVGCAGTDGSARRVFSDCELAKVDGGFENPGLLSSHKELNKFPELYALLFESGKVGIYYGNAPKNAYKPKIYSDKDGVRCYWERDKENLNEKTVLTISIDSSVANCRPRILNGLFSFDALNSIEGLEYFITDSVKDMGYMFAGSQLNTIDLRSFYTSSLKNTYKMFSDCSELKTIYVGDGWAVEGLSGNGMFAGCSNLVGGAGTKWTGSKTSAVYARIDGGEENPGYFTKAKIDTFIIDGLKYVITDRMHVSVGWESSTEDTIVIPQKVTYKDKEYIVNAIMDEGFSMRYLLKSVVIPESVTKIGKRAFYDDYNIFSLEVPSSVTSIGASAFVSIRNVVYAGDAEGSPWGAIAHNGDVDYDLKFIFSDTTRTKLLKYFGNDSIVVIPNTVKELGKSSFTKAIEMKHVELNNVEKIDDKAFRATGLQEISLSNKIKYIGTDAFFATSISKVLIPSSVDTLGGRAFATTDTVCCTHATLPGGNGILWHRGWAQNVNTVIYNCKLLNVTVESSDSNTVEVSGHVGIDAEGAYWYEDSASATINAVPCKGYEFVQWSDNVNENPRTFIITADTTITAIFEKQDIPLYVLTYKVDDKVYQRDTIAFGDTVVAIKKPTKEGYTFSGWKNVPTTMPAKNVTVTGSFKVNSYVITYKVDGEVYQQDSIAFGDTIVAIKKPTKEGYTFSGWKNVPTTMPAKNVTVTGSFKAKNYVITYKVDDKVYQTDTLAYGETIVAAEEPTKEGATFNGWSKLPETMPAKDLIVTGTFSGKSYVITYKVDGKVYQKDTLNAGSTVVAGEEPKKEGYTFIGWKNLTDTMPSQNVTVTAMFVVNTYALTYKVDGEVYQQDSIAFGDTVVAIKKPTKEGYTFSGWKNVPTTMPAKNVTVTGSFKAKSYVITYKVDDKVYQTDTVAYGETIVAAKEPTKEGATFSGWSKLPETMPAKDLIVTGTFSGKSYVITYKVDGKVYQKDTLNAGSTVVAGEEPKKEGYTFIGWKNLTDTMPSQNVTVTAMFVVNTYALTYKVDGEVYQQDSIAFGDTVVAIKKPTKEGYTFSGWKNVPTTMPAKDVTVTGSFKAKNYVITYKVDDKVYQTDTLAYGETIVAAKEPKKEGATFSGWSKLPETMPAQNLIVTGTFSGKSYVITYKVDGKLYQRDTLNQGSTVIAAEEPEKEGYTFSGWENVPETMPAKNVTVNGTFTVNDYILTYMVDEDVYYTDTLHYGDAITEIEVPEKKNYVFNGWIELPETMPAEDLTVIASFRPYSGVDEHNSEMTLVWSANKMIFIQVEKKASYIVYNMLGHVMAQGEAEEGDTQVSMPAQGVYQVVVDKSRRTVLVR